MSHDSGVFVSDSKPTLAQGGREALKDHPDLVAAASPITTARTAALLQPLCITDPLSLV